MGYKMEELVAIVGKLAEKYTGFESTSITYERAEQLMGAVLYCIREAEMYEDGNAVLAGNPSAEQVYELGLGYVEEKTKEALALYNELVPEFKSYENQCLYDAFVKGIPEFFKWYDIKFNPQDTILTLDYPVSKDLSGYTGIDRIYEFIKCISVEQRFLSRFPESYVINVLAEYSDLYKEMVENICEIVLEAERIL